MRKIMSNLAEEKILEKLCNIDEYLKIIIWPNIRNVFQNPKQFLAYDISDGEKGVSEIGRIVGVSHTAVRNWWQEWEKLGIAEKVGSKGQYRKTLTLFELFVLFGDQSNGENKNE